ncbi:translation elongation factor Ts [Rickettsiales bacterium]|nr:translation elongation factor Ts [Rickettsiales bacterium]MDB2550504.1 translation elongation factor Ts [Rickettsiales bacterium]
MANLKLVKELRSQTGSGIADCNKALAECNDNLQDAIDYLRKKGLSSAAKKSSRTTSEGLVSTIVNNNKAAIIEVNAETDFVSKNDKFQNLVENITNIAINFDDLASLKAANYTGSEISIEDEIKNQIAVIGENINLRRISSIAVTKGVITQYIHNKVKGNMGKLGVLVALESESADSDKLEELGKQIAMHIAASKPEALDISSISEEKLARETEILKEQARASGKPENIIEKMIQGRIRKYYEEIVLLEQNFVMDDKIKVKDLLKNYSKDLSSEVKIKDFKLFLLGEGVEKKEEDFADEVNKIINK